MVNIEFCKRKVGLPKMKDYYDLHVGTRFVFSFTLEEIEILKEKIIEVIDKENNSE